MAKINYSKVEEALISSQRKAFIDDLHELAALANLERGNGHQKISIDEINKLTLRFQNDLKQLKSHDPDFYLTLNLSESQETRLLSSDIAFTSAEWSLLLSLKEKMGTWKKNLKGSAPEDKDYSAEVEKTRKKQKNARFNVNPKWMPL